MIIFLTLSIYGLSVRYDAFEAIVEFANAHEDWEVDEIFTFLILSSISLMVMAFRNAKRLRFENKNRKIAENKAHKLAFYDPLTNLPNRSLCIDRIKNNLAHAKRSHYQIGVLFIDLDNFKIVNDSFGHHAGDAVLKVTADRLQTSLRENDTLARISGDEFIAVLGHLSNLDHLTQVANKLISALAEPFHVEGNQLTLGCSIGIAAYPMDGNDAEELIKHADTAMYQAKRSGRNTFRFFAEEMDKNSRRRILISNRLRNAIEQNTLTLLYQPQYAMHSGEILSVEALLRWQDAELGSISPLEFIPVAEETGLIVEIGAWVLRTACAQNKAWQEKGMPMLKVAVNVSGRQLWYDGFSDIVSDVLKETGLSPEYLELELTETIIMRDPDAALRMLSAIKSLGVSLALDDFGTGYSSLSYLKKLDVDKLKIDKSFIDGVPDDRDSSAIVAATFSLANALSMEVTAEGVESAQQLEFLKQFDCDFLQGFFFSKPLPPAEIEILLQP